MKKIIFAAFSVIKKWNKDFDQFYVMVDCSTKKINAL